MQIDAINIKGIVRKIDSSLVSTSKYNKMIPFFLWKKIPENSWIICLRYGSGSYNIQVGITGTCWKHEPPELSLTREIQEETGLVITQEPDFLAETIKGNKKWLWGVCNTNKCRSSYGIQTFFSGVDEKDRKVGAILYSTNKDMTLNKIINSSKEGGLYFLQSDNIIEILLVPKSLAMKWTLPIKIDRSKLCEIDNITKELYKLKSTIPIVQDLAAWPRGGKVIQNHKKRLIKY